ncbi:MAG: hypothetical protein QOK37_2284 [Thermoanaerobaculia bacterium]|jgi:hypothetical protein|nr:hypothetical protein [Thermoanaerobaculia bacterium]
MAKGHRSTPCPQSQHYAYAGLTPTLSLDFWALGRGMDRVSERRA